MLTWILEHSGRKPGFLVGGVPANFNVTARLGEGAHFVVEADEYDTAFFDKRAKFVHYRPRTAILNNLEHDHADIYPDVAAIQKQFHLLLRMVPGNGRLVVNGADVNLQQVIDMGCWTPVVKFSANARHGEWHADLQGSGDGSQFVVQQGEKVWGEVRWNLLGQHNVDNALAALIAAEHAGVSVVESIAALNAFGGVKRRMEVRGVVNGVTVYDDFAHHPTAIATTMHGLRRKVGKARILAVLEPRSNTMKLGTHREPLKQSLQGAEQIWLYQGADVKWDVASLAAELGPHARVYHNIEQMVAALAAEARSGDQVLIMSNGGFGGIHGKLLARLGETPAS
jgi:UDP-N-acetylmuramate: L-alanyl-gamma-D-glutamyl-meso-diaminopimelate ligase